MTILKKISNWFRSYLKVFKTIFLITVLFIVSSELLSIARSISLAQLKLTISMIPSYKVLLMILVGIIAIVPMTGYDFVLNKMLHQQQPKRYIFATSWLVNTVNNIAGFGGLVSIGLRSEFYNKDNEPKEVMSALSKILLFLEAGLSILSFLSLVLILSGQTAAFLKQYWIWLVGGSLYFPLVYVITRLKKKGLLGGLTGSQLIELTLTSFLEWSGVVLTFVVVGWALGISVHLADILPLFIASSVIGIVSMIPGALGSFDVLMIFGLSSLGIPRATTVIWLVLFRLVYYVIPLMIGGTFFFNNTWSTINTRYSGIPKKLALEFFQKVVVFLLYFSGILIILLATIPQGFAKIPWLKMINLFHYQIVTQFPNIILGFSLLVMGRGIAARVKRAYWPTILLLGAAIIYTFIFDFSYVTLFVLGLMLILIVISRSELYREQLVYSWQWLTIDSFIIGVLIIFYTIIGVYNHPAFHHHGKTLAFFLFPSEKLWVSGFIAILIVAIFMLLFLRYLEGQKIQIGVPLDEERVLKILNQYGGNPDSQLVFLGDKSVYFYNDGAEDTVFFQFATYNSKCVVMGDPAGKKEDFRAAIQQFLQEADRWGYQPIFYETNETSVISLHELGYDFIKMGEQALVDLDTFTISGKKMKGVRSTVNKLTKEGYQFMVIQPPFDQDFLATLQEISDSWLHGRKEKGFSLGFFSADYLQRGPIAVVKNQNNEIVSFANIMPTYTQSIGSIDLMRHHSEQAPSGSMDFLFVHLFDYMKSQGLQYFDLGMAPLSNVGLSKKSFTQERIAHLVFEFGSHFYSFQGLRDYKEKYTPKWVSRYTLYSRKDWLIYDMIVILLVDNKVVKQKPIKS